PKTRRFPARRQCPKLRLRGRCEGVRSNPEGLSLTGKAHLNATLYVLHGRGFGFLAVAKPLPSLPLGRGGGRGKCEAGDGSLLPLPEGMGPLPYIFPNGAFCVCKTSKSGSSIP